jgi:hypothetical protein
MKLSDGSIISSNYDTNQQSDARQGIREDIALRTGIITHVFYTDDAQNISIQFIEYNVMVTSSNSDGSLNSITYRNCRHMDIFGAINKHENFVMETSSNNKKDQGSQCLIMCIDGINAAGRAIIIGGLQDANREPWKRADGQFYDFIYNGLNININKDGEYALTFNSYVDQQGIKANPLAAGTAIKIDKEGNYSVSTNESQTIKVDRASQQISISDTENNILIDKKNKQLSISSSGSIEETANKSMTHMAKDYTLNAGSSITEKAIQSVTIEAGSSMKQKAGSSWDVQAGANVTIKSGANVTIEGGAIAKLKGTMTQLGGGTTPIALVGSQIIGACAVGPVTGTIITGSFEVLGS